MGGSSGGASGGSSSGGFGGYGSTKSPGGTGYGGDIGGYGTAGEMSSGAGGAAMAGYGNTGAGGSGMAGISSNGGGGWNGAAMGYNTPGSEAAQRSATSLNYGVAQKAGVNMYGNGYTMAPGSVTGFSTPVPTTTKPLSVPPGTLAVGTPAQTHIANDPIDQHPNFSVPGGVVPGPGIGRYGNPSGLGLRPGLNPAMRDRNTYQGSGRASPPGMNQPGYGKNEGGRSPYGSGR
jgi:hypothetical protein